MSKVIYCDGGKNKHTGDEAWGSVVDNEGVDLIERHLDLFEDMTIRSHQKLAHEFRHVISCRFNDVASQQNNGAELLALIGALRIAITQEDGDGLKYTKIYTDSDLLFKWWSKGQVNKTTLGKMDERKKAFIFECKELREMFEEKGGAIEKISGSKNKADLGWH